METQRALDGLHKDSSDENRKSLDNLRNLKQLCDTGIWLDSGVIHAAERAAGSAASGLASCIGLIQRQSIITFPERRWICQTERMRKPSLRNGHSIRLALTASWKAQRVLGGAQRCAFVYTLKKARTMCEWTNPLHLQSPTLFWKNPFSQLCYQLCSQPLRKLYGFHLASDKSTLSLAEIFGKENASVKLNAYE